MEWIWVLLLVTAVNGDYVDIPQHENISRILNLNTMCSNFRGANVSEECWEQLDVVCDNSILRRICEYYLEYYISFATKYTLKGTLHRQVMKYI